MHIVYSYTCIHVLYICIHACMYAYIYISNSYVQPLILYNIVMYVCIYVLCMFSGLTKRYWTTNQCALPWRQPLLSVSEFLFYDCTLCKVEASLASPSTLACQLLSSFSSSCLGSHVGKFFEYNYWLSYKTHSQSKFPLLILTTFMPPFSYQLQTLCRIVILQLYLLGISKTTMLFIDCHFY